MSNVSETLEKELKELQEVKEVQDKDKQTAEKIMNAVIKK